MSLAIEQKKQGETLALELSGRLSAMEAKGFDAAFAEAAQGAKEALLDFSGVEYISSAGLRSLFRAKKRMTQQGGDLKVLYPTPEVMDVFATTRYDNLVTIVQRGEDAPGPVFYPPAPRAAVDGGHPLPVGPFHHDEHGRLDTAASFPELGASRAGHQRCAGRPRYLPLPAGVPSRDGGRLPAL